mgnify:CR=1 FL=1
MADRNSVGIQLVDRNDELCILFEKVRHSNVNQSLFFFVSFGLSNCRFFCFLFDWSASIHHHIISLVLLPQVTVLDDKLRSADLQMAEFDKVGGGGLQQFMIYFLAVTTFIVEDCTTSFESFLFSPPRNTRICSAFLMISSAREDLACPAHRKSRTLKTRLWSSS